MNPLITTISQVESIWLEPLYKFCQQQFSTVKIPSHDDLHHLRVWNLAKLLLLELADHNTEFSFAEIEQIIIAVFFHDVGMVKTIDKKHGLAGSHICASYFNDNYPTYTGDLVTILDAIKKHDDKEYKNMVYHGDMYKNILSILCVCDDLDAFGAIGVFRYMEIYMLRGFEVCDLAEIILPNIESRYQNFHQLYFQLTNFHQKETKNFEFIRDFYTKLQSEFINDDWDKKSGAQGVLTLFIDGILKGRATINTISNFALENSVDSYVRSFFIQFSKDVSS